MRRFAAILPPRQPIIVWAGLRGAASIAAGHIRNNDLRGDCLNDEAGQATRRTAVRQHTVDGEQAGQRLDRLLARLLADVPRTRIFRLIRRGEVRVNGKRAGPDVRVAEGDVLRIPPIRPAETLEPVAGAGRTPRVPPSLLALIESSVLYQDAQLLVLDKPAGVAVHGGSGLSFGVIEALRASRPEETLELAHRLDRDTSGVLLIARKPAALRVLHALLRDGEVEKRYLTLLAGRWELGHKLIDAPLQTDARVHGERTVRVAADGKRASTEFRLVEQLAGRASLVEATLHTGRTHQIRVHAAYCGHPVAGDEKYGDAEFNQQIKELGLKRMFLHAHSCSFRWPGGNEVHLSAPLPPELRNALDGIAALRPLRGRRNRTSAAPRRAGSTAGRRVR